jgi:hypothetical protein
MSNVSETENDDARVSQPQRKNAHVAQARDVRHCSREASPVTGKHHHKEVCRANP